MMIIHYFVDIKIKITFPNIDFAIYLLFLLDAKRSEN